jgi:DNA-binding XRE family transcriptional regulator
MDLQKLQGVFRALRESAGVTQAEMAEALDVSQGCISRMERQDAEVRLRHAVAYLRACDLHVMDLVLAWLKPETEKDFAELALRAFGLPSSHDPPPEVHKLAVEALVHQRRKLQEVLMERSEEARLEELLVELERLAHPDDERVK